ncbi:MAG TPA: hydroxyisourate hydrolase [Polaromonas sp.]|jgi:5-hydroxyisourate hydrolase|nr:hydroxyisourate hydrolase [Ideonella sp.]
MAGISTHVLDNFTGRPGAGMRIDFSVREKDGSWKLVKTMTTNADGRTDQPVLAPEAAAVGEYELGFHLGDFYERQGARPADPLFVDKVVPLRFAIFDAKQHYHVPMLCTPWSCSTYRGS